MMEEHNLQEEQDKGIFCQGRHAEMLFVLYLNAQKDLNLGVMIKSRIALQEFQRVAIAFVDNTDFHTNGDKFKENKQRIMNMRAKLCKATGSKIQQDKMFFYCWQ